MNNRKNEELKDLSTQGHDNHNHDNHNHGHKGHGHHHGINEGNLGLTVFLNMTITIAQVIGGLLSGSLSLLSDAAHNFSDVIALIISYLANKLARKPYSKEKTFGYKRAEILAAVINVTSIIVIAFFIFIEAIDRWNSSVSINGMTVILLAFLSIAVNGLSVMLIAKDSKENINMRSAYMHLFSDMLTSIAVLIAGAAMYFFNLYWIDTVLSICIAVYLIYVSFTMLFEALSVLMQFAPSGYDEAKIRSMIGKIDGIKNIHHIHAWRLTDVECHFEAHVEMDKDYCLSDISSKMEEIRRILSAFGFTHITLEAEYESNHKEDMPCHGCSSAQ